MHKFVAPEDLWEKLSYKKTLYEILTIDSELLFLIYLNWDTILFNLRDELLNLWSKCN